jgi:hypothetical protein
LSMSVCGLVFGQSEDGIHAHLPDKAPVSVLYHGAPTSVEHSPSKSLNLPISGPAASPASVLPYIPDARNGCQNQNSSPDIVLPLPVRRRDAWRRNWPLTIIAYGFFLLGIGINVWNAMSGGTVFLPASALSLPMGRQATAWALFAFISVFALTNSLRMASTGNRPEPTTASLVPFGPGNIDRLGGRRTASVTRSALADTWSASVIVGSQTRLLRRLTSVSPSASWPAFAAIAAACGCGSCKCRSVAESSPHFLK